MKGLMEASETAFGRFFPAGCRVAISIGHPARARRQVDARSRARAPVDRRVALESFRVPRSDAIFQSLSRRGLTTAAGMPQPAQGNAALPELLAPPSTRSARGLWLGRSRRPADRRL